MYTAFNVFFKPLTSLINVYGFLLGCTCDIAFLVNAGKSFIVYRT